MKKKRSNQKKNDSKLYGDTPKTSMQNSMMIEESMMTDSQRDI